ncbi:MAG: site-specific integrase [Pseudomonadota bacterium]
MATGRITKRAVDALPSPPHGKRGYLWDTDLKGFGVMVTDKGAKSYLVQYRIGGRGHPTRRFTIGRHGSPWTPDTARDRAREVLEQVHRKIDPVDAEKARLAELRQASEQEVMRQAENEKLAFSAVAKEYGSWCDNNLKRASEQKAIVERDLEPAFGDTPLNQIDPDDIKSALGKVAERSASASLKAYVALSGLYAFASERHGKLLPPNSSPLLQVKRPAGAGNRDRYLDRREQRLMWEAAGMMGWPFGPIYRLLMLTGLRLREVAWAHWSEVDLAEKSWLVPAERTKNGEPHWVHLSAPALKILKELPRIKNHEGPDLLFTTTGTSPVSGFSRAKSRLVRLMDKIEAQDAKEESRDPVHIPSFIIHDTRRTMARECQRMQVSPEIVERLLGHVTHTKSGLKGTYQVYEYEPERIDAVNRWAGQLATNVSRDSSVVSLRGAA